MLDDTVTSGSGAESPSAEISSASTGVDTSSLAGATGSEALVSTGAPSNEPTGQETTAQAPEDPFAKYTVPEDANLIQVREAHKQLLNDHRESQKASQSFDQWKPIVEQYNDPSQLQTLASLANGLFTPQMENGQPVYRDGMPAITTTPALQMLAEQSPTTLIQLADDLGNFTFQGRPVIDWQLEALGLNPANIEKYAEWEKNGGPVAQSGGAVTDVQLSEIPAEFHEVFKTLPANVRDDLLLNSESSRDYFLRSAKAQQENAKFMQAQTQKEEQDRQNWMKQEDSKRAQAQEQAVADIRTSTFTDIAKSIADLDWKPSADDAINKASHALVMGAITSLADPVWRPLIEPLLPGLKVDGAQFDSFMNQIDQYTRQAKAYELAGDQFNAKRAMAQRDNAVFQVKAQANKLKAEVVGMLNGTAVERRQQLDSSINSAAARLIPQGQSTPGGTAPVDPYKAGQFKPFSAESVAYQKSLLAK